MFLFFQRWEFVRVKLFKNISPFNIMCFLYVESQATSAFTYILCKHKGNVWLQFQELCDCKACITCLPYMHIWVQLNILWWDSVISRLILSLLLTVLCCLILSCSISTNGLGLMWAGIWGFMSAQSTYQTFPLNFLTIWPFHFFLSVQWILLTSKVVFEVEVVYEPISLCNLLWAFHAWAHVRFFPPSL